MAINKDIVKFLRKKPLQNPTADDLFNEFQECINYCDSSKQVLTMGFWRIFLNITDQTYRNWQNAGLNKGMNEVEFNDRLAAIKKIDNAIEDGMTDELLKAAKNPAGIIFYLKNAFKWTDRHEPEVSLNLNVDGYKPPAPRSDNRPIETNIETNDHKPLQ